jgi:hypothetical protein
VCVCVSFSVYNEHLGFVFQTFNLLANLSAYENVELPMTILGKLSQAERRRRTIELLKSMAVREREATHWGQRLTRALVDLPATACVRMCTCARVVLCVCVPVRCFSLSLWGRQWWACAIAWSIWYVAGNALAAPKLGFPH